MQLNILRYCCYGKKLDAVEDVWVEGTVVSDINECRKTCILNLHYNGTQLARIES
jgi:hypothetical protein